MEHCVSAYSKAINSQWNKAFVEKYDISKSKVKQNLVVVINYFKNVHLEEFRKKNKRCLKKQYNTILTKELTTLTINLDFL